MQRNSSIQAFPNRDVLKHRSRSKLAIVATMVAAVHWLGAIVVIAADDGRYHTDSDARFLHHIDLYDYQNNKITPKSDRPYSPRNTCGRCHNYPLISHGWHFSALSPEASNGRPGAPWIWTDNRTGTQLPLSLRKWHHTFDPREIGITPWDLTHHFGARIPGGSVGTAADDDYQSQPGERWQLTGGLEIDCMVCHAGSGVYDINVRRDQIEDENFAYVPTAAIRLGTIDGFTSRMKDDVNPDSDDFANQRPKVAYDPRRFGLDGKVFMDLIRKPTNNACFQCHSNRLATDAGIQRRWLHDGDVHLRAGMACVDCHRNGIDHHIVRGYEGEENPSGHAVGTLSCAGCHLGDESGSNPSTNRLAGRLGSPRPLHRGLPPIHFEKLSCTACHSGPVPHPEPLRLLTSLSHELGERAHRTGQELPVIMSPVYASGEDGRIHPNAVMWPAFWGYVDGDNIVPLPPTRVRDAIRKPLRVRKNFAEELLEPKLKSSDLKALLGDERAKVNTDQWTPEESEKVTNRQRELGRQAFAEKVSKALGELEAKMQVDRAVYVSAGEVYTRGDKPAELTQLSPANRAGIEMIRWPIAHNVRPAGWSLGVRGCTECHSDEGLIFTSTVSAVGPIAGDSPPLPMYEIQGLAADQRLAWNQLFQGRKAFKYIAGGSLAILIMCLLIGIGGLAARTRNIRSAGSR